MVSHQRSIMLLSIRFIMLTTKDPFMQWWISCSFLYPGVSCVMIMKCCINSSIKSHVATHNLINSVSMS